MGNNGLSNVGRNDSCICCCCFMDNWWFCCGFVLMTAPSLGATATEVWRNWRDAKNTGSSLVEGRVIVTGTYFWHPTLGLCLSIATTKRTMASFVPATEAEQDDVFAAICQGMVQIVSCPPRGVAGGYGSGRDRPTFILHQATCRAIPE